MPENATSYILIVPDDDLRAAEDHGYDLLLVQHPANQDPVEYISNQARALLGRLDGETQDTLCNGADWADYFEYFHAVPGVICLTNAMTTADRYRPLMFPAAEEYGRPECPDCHGKGWFWDSTGGFSFRRVCGLCRRD